MIVLDGRTNLCDVDTKLTDLFDQLAVDDVVIDGRQLGADRKFVAIAD